MTTTPAALVRELDEKATRGPWAVEENVLAGGIVHLAVTNRAEYAAGRDWMACSLTMQSLARASDRANGTLIVTLRNALLALATLLEAADALRGGSVVVTCGEWARLCENYDEARAAFVETMGGTT